MFRKEISRKEIDPEIIAKVTKNTIFFQWTFNTDIMNVIKYRQMKLRFGIDAKIKSSNTDRFICKACNKEYDGMDVYTKNYHCLFCDQPLEKQKKACKNPERLRKESNRIFQSIESSLKLLDDFKIPREFFGFDPINKPNFNLPQNVMMRGFNNHFANLKIKPTVRVQFTTLKDDEDP